MSYSVEDKIYDHQEAIIASKYGAMEAGRANYGWGVDDAEEYISVETKVYGPAMKLTTTVNYKNQDDLEDDWESYR